LIFSQRFCLDEIFVLSKLPHFVNEPVPIDEILLLSGCGGVSYQRYRDLGRIIGFKEEGGGETFNTDVEDTVLGCLQLIIRDS
jgi:hypothetical protein